MLQILIPVRTSLLSGDTKEAIDITETVKSIIGEFVALQRYLQDTE